MGKCLESQITIDTSTLVKIVHDPQTILENEEAFREEEKAQKYTKLWAEGVGAAHGPGELSWGPHRAFGGEL